MPSGQAAIKWTPDNVCKLVLLLDKSGGINLTDEVGRKVAAGLGCPVSSIKTFFARRRGKFAATAPPLSPDSDSVPKPAIKRKAGTSGKSTTNKARKHIKTSKPARRAKIEDSDEAEEELILNDDEEEEDISPDGWISPPIPRALFKGNTGGAQAAIRHAPADHKDDAEEHADDEENNNIIGSGAGGMDGSYSPPPYARFD